MILQNKFKIYLSTYDEDTEKHLADSWLEIDGLYQETYTFVENVLDVKEDYIIEPEDKIKFEILISNYMLLLAQLRGKK